MSDISQSLALRDTRWADGLRGIASIFVVSSHLVRGYAPYLLQPRITPDDPIRFYNFPFFRVFLEGQPWVAVFLILTGFVNALKPIKQARAGQKDAALASLASSTFRRTSRLMLPCAVATVISWVIANLGGYNIGRMLDSGWMNYTSPSRSGSVWAAFVDLWNALYSTWARSDNLYDKNQWTMQWFLKGSMVLFVTLLATVRATSKYRMLIILGLFLYSWRSADTMVGIPIYSGALLAEFSFTSPILGFSASKRLLPRLIPFSIFLTGWYFMSYPNAKPELASWSDALRKLGAHIVPTGGDPYNIYNAIGVMLLTLAILLSHTLQDFFTRPTFLWLGSHSFPIYLLHGPLLRSVLNWMLCLKLEPRWVEEFDEDGDLLHEKPVLDLPPPWRFAIAIPVFFAILLVASAWWMRVVEPRCASVTVWLENKVTGKATAAAPSILPVSHKDDEVGDDVEKVGLLAEMQPRRVRRLFDPRHLCQAGRRLISSRA